MQTLRSPETSLSLLLACLLARRLGQGPGTPTPSLSRYAKVWGLSVGVIAARDSAHLAPIFTLKCPSPYISRLGGFAGADSHSVRPLSLQGLAKGAPKIGTQAHRVAQPGNSTKNGTTIVTTLVVFRSLFLALLLLYFRFVVCVACVRHGSPKEKQV